MTAIQWKKHSVRETWAAQTPIGLVTVALRAAAGRQQQWTAVTSFGLRIATGRTADECRENAEAQIARLVAKKQEAAHDQPR